MTNRPKKIAFVMCAGKAASAGHHYSARDLASEFARHGIEAHHVALQLPSTASPAALSNQPNVHLLKVAPASLSSLIALRNALLRPDFDAILPMDELAVRLVFAVLPDRLARIIPIKPAGVNSDAWSAAFEDFICFSRENIDYYKCRPKYKRCNLHLIPQRVSRLHPAQEVLDQFNERIGRTSGDRIIIAGGRIDLGSKGGPGKKPIFLGAVRLFKELSKHAPQVRLVLAGAPKCSEDVAWLEQLRSEDPRITIVTERHFTDHLSQLFHAADFVVAMGRTAMEALSLGRPTFIPAGDDTLPVLVSQDNFSLISDYNFTHRFSTDLTNESKDTRADKLSALLPDAGFQSSSLTSKALFDEHLNTERAIPKYMQLFNTQRRTVTAYALMSWPYTCLRVATILGRSLISRR